MFKKILLTLTLLVSAGTASAATCQQQIANISGLDAQTKQEMIISCEQAKLTTIVTPEQAVTAEKINKYAEAAKAFAEALGVAAKELGIAVNEFLGTTAGKLTAAMILWKVLGAQLLSISYFLFATLLSGVLASGLRKHVMLSHYDTADKGKKYPVYYTYKEASDNQVVILVITYIAQVAVVLIAGGVAF